MTMKLGVSAVCLAAALWVGWYLLAPEAGGARKVPASHALSPGEHRDSKAQSANPTVTEPGRALTSTQNHRVKSVVEPQQAIFTAPNAATAIEEARAAYGDTRDIVIALGDVEHVCAQNLDQWGSLTAQGGDKRRMWAAEKLLDRCKGIDKIARPTNLLEIDTPTRIWEKNGREAGVAAALAAVRASNVTQDLIEAGKVLLETQALPLEQMFGADVPPLADMQSAWIHAGSLVACEASSSCGADSIRTLGLCINVGCSEGADLRRAMSDAFAARQMRTIDAIYAWMISQRRGS